MVTPEDKDRREDDKQNQGEQVDATDSGTGLVIHEQSPEDFRKLFDAWRNKWKSITERSVPRDEGYYRITLLYLEELRELLKNNDIRLAELVSEDIITQEEFDEIKKEADDLSTFMRNSGGPASEPWPGSPPENNPDDETIETKDAFDEFRDKVVLRLRAIRTKIPATAFKTEEEKNELLEQIRGLMEELVDWGLDNYEAEGVAVDPRFTQLRTSVLDIQTRIESRPVETAAAQESNKDNQLFIDLQEATAFLVTALSHPNYNPRTRIVQASFRFLSEDEKALSAADLISERLRKSRRIFQYYSSQNARSESDLEYVEYLEATYLEPAEKLIQALENRSKELDDQDFQAWKTQLSAMETTPGTPINTLLNFLNNEVRPEDFATLGDVDTMITNTRNALENVRTTFANLQPNRAAVLREKYLDRGVRRLEELAQIRDFFDWNNKIAQLTNLMNSYQTTAAQPDIQRYELADMFEKIEEVLTKLEGEGDRTMSPDSNTNRENPYIKNRIEQLRSQIDVMRANVERPGSDNVTVKRYREYTLYSLFREWYTMSLNKTGEPKYAFEQVMNEKLSDLQREFIEHLQSLLPANASPARRSQARQEAISRHRGFVELMGIVNVLIDFEILATNALNVMQLTAKHETILSSAKNKDAMTYNTNFNNHPLVNVDGFDLETHAAPSMGVVQKMCYAAFQEMQKKPYTPEQIQQALSSYNANPAGYDYRASGLPPVILVDGVPTVTSNFDQSLSVFSRNQGFTAEASARLFDATMRVTKIKTRQGVEVDLKIQEEILRYPDEARILLKHIAMQKAARDSVGEDAGAIHLGLNKGAFKFDDGKEPRPANVLASICYQVGKNSAIDRHMAMLQWVDLKDYDLLEYGRPAANRDDYRGWTNPNNKTIILETQHVRRFDKWHQPQKYKDSIKRNIYTPTKWYQDAPRLSEFFNQTEDPRLSGDYTRAMGAILKIIEFATDSRDMRLGTITDELKEKVRVEVMNFNSEIGKAMAYIGAYEGPGSKYGYVHEFILAAYHEFLANILCAVPGGEPPITSKLLGSLVRREYEELYKSAVDTMRETIDLNSTVTAYWQYLTGHGGGFDFIGQDFRRQWRRQENASKDFQNWKLDHLPEYRHTSLLNQAKILSARPVSPTNVHGGWKSSYVNAGPQSA